MSNRLFRYARRLEPLEDRLALSAAPAVESVELWSPDWDSSFTSHLQSNGLGHQGFALGEGADQLRTLPWSDVTKLSVRFDQDVVVDVNDLTLTGHDVTQYAFDDFIYDPQARTATWTLSQALDDDRVLIDLNADGVDPITNLAGDRLDGDWTDEVSTFSSGDGLAGGDFEFTFHANPGDADRNGWVDYFDYVFVYYANGLATTDAGYDPFYDIDGSGMIDAADHAAVFAELGGNTLSGTPAGAGLEAPTGAATAYLEVSNDALDYTYSLSGHFTDPDGGGAMPAFSIASNSSPSLFDSVTIDSVTGNLIVNSASGVSGRAEIEVTATDTDGLSSSVIVTVDINRSNAAPWIQHFHASPFAGNTYVILGKVHDDQDPTGIAVTISGAIMERAVVWDDDWFELTVIVDPAGHGPIVATVTDDQGDTGVAFSYLGWS